MAKQKMFNKVRTDTLELMIAQFDAIGNFQAAEAIRKLAKKISAPIDTNWIEIETIKIRKFYNEYSEKENELYQE